MAELGRIQRLSIEEFKGKRRLFCIPNIFTPQEVDDNLKNLLEKYWQETISHVEKLEKLGFVTKIFVETIFIDGQEAIDVIRDTNSYLYILIERKVAEGAKVIGIENPETFGAYIDWRYCLSVVRTSSVMEKVFHFFKEIAQKRIEEISLKINESLQDGESAILILRDQDRVKLSLPKDIEIFLVVPSAYDDILRYLMEISKV
jgi:hypothetical protein